MAVKKGKLTPKQQCFVNEYLIDLNATQAAIRAGYSPKMAAKLVAKGSISEAIQKAMEKRQERTEITQDSVLSDIEAIKKDAMQQVTTKAGGKAMIDHQAALRAAELQGKHLGMFPTKIEQSGPNGGPIPHMNATVSPEELKQAVRNVPDKF